MLDKYIPRSWLLKKRLMVIETLATSDCYYYFLTLIENKKGSVKIIETRRTDAESFAKEKISLPVLLVINGTGTILKKTDAIFDGNAPDDFIKNNFPGIGSREFYLQLYPSTNSAFVSFCRRTQADSVLESIRKTGVEIAGIYISPAIVLSLKGLSEGGQVVANHYTLNTSVDTSDVFVRTSGGDHANDFNGFQVPFGYTAGFAAGLNYFASLQEVVNVNGEIDHVPRQHLEKSAFRIKFIAAVAIALFLTLGNLAFYLYYLYKHEHVQVRLAKYQKIEQEINDLGRILNNNKELLSQTGAGDIRQVLSPSTDRICSTIPEQITLCELRWNPEKKDRREKLTDIPLYDQNTLKVSGFCTKSYIVNEWLSALKGLDFVKSAALQYFVYRPGESGQNFEILLKVK